MSHDRACAALIVGSQILMVRHVESGSEYWTLPGGGIEPGETPEQCAERELLEETGVKAHAIEQLWKHGRGPGDDPGLEYCFLMKLASLDQGNRAILGSDPEQSHMTQEARLLQGVGWKQLLEVRDDSQVAMVLEALK